MCYFGYSVHDGEKVYDDLTFDSKFLIISQETAFAVDFLYEQKLHILHSNATFQGLSDTYNDFHNFEESNLMRKELNRKRLSDAFFLYGLLEYSSRSNIDPKFTTEKSWLDKSLLSNQDKINDSFARDWTGDHVCNVENCESMMISDGGMNINRPVCAQKFSLLRKFSNSDKYVLTGCTASPSPDGPFCPQHKNSDTPIILKENLRIKTRKVLQDYRMKTKKNFHKCSRR